MDPHTAELLEIAAGQEAAFARFVSRAEAAVRAHLASFAAHADTEAVLQEAFLRTWQVAPRVASGEAGDAAGRPDPLLRLVLRIARNLAIDEVRRHRRMLPSDLDALEQAAEASADGLTPAQPDPLLRRLISACLALLPTQPRRALEARLTSAGGEPDATLAAGLGMRLNTFLQNFGRARRLLGACLRDRGVALEEVP